MLPRVLGGLLALSCCIFAQRPRGRDYDLYDYYAIHVEPSRQAADVSQYLGLELEGQLGDLTDHYIFRSPRHEGDVVHAVVQEHKERKRKRSLGYANDLLDGILLHQKQKLKPPMVKRGIIPFEAKRQQQQQDYSSGQAEVDPLVKAAEDKRKEIAGKLGIRDPIFNEQWHLFNTIQHGHDLNVTGVWLDGITGKNATVCIVDDGLDMDSEDIRDNYFAEGSYDFNDKVEEPKPRLDDDRHGTRCAGEVAAVKNNVCGVGVAYDARISGLRILSKPITDADEAEAMIYKYQKNDIYSCSWGPPDNGQEMGAPGILIKRAMMQAVQKGRHGFGTIYVFAAGNGAASDDNCNFDGYTNSIYSVTIGAVDREGLHPYYSEKCSAQLAVTYSSGSGDAIHTTDIGAHECYANHGGTSAAGPLAAGIYALVLQVRPQLTWRDIQWLTVETAVQLEADDLQETALGKKYSHQFGYGKLDAWALVDAAKTFKPVKPQAWFFSPWQHIRHEIPQGNKGLRSTFVVSKEALNKANLHRLEHVTVTMNINHTRRGDIMVDLRSPEGIVSHLSTPRRGDEAQQGYIDWTFMSVAHWGESGEGAWTIIVKDVNDNEHNGTFIDWRLKLFGECDNPTHQSLLALPTEHDDDDHDREGGVVSTASVDIPTQTATDAPTGNPSDHPHRPVNAKPTDATHAFDPPAAVTSSWGGISSVGASSTAAPVSSPKPTPVEDYVPPDSFLPSPFPTFGVSKRTQIWIYGAAALIIIFCISLAVYFWLARRKRLRNLAREQYEFEMVNEDDEDEERRGLRGRAGGRRGRRRAGELYDAFAGESDEDFFSDGEDDYPSHEKYEDFRDEKSRRSPPSGE